MVNILSVQKIYLDNKGGGRIYIPQDLIKQLGWKHNERIVIVQEDGEMRIVKEETYQNEVKA